MNSITGAPMFRRCSNSSFSHQNMETIKVIYVLIFAHCHGSNISFRHWLSSCCLIYSAPWQVTYGTFKVIHFNWFQCWGWLVSTQRISDEPVLINLVITWFAFSSSDGDDSKIQKNTETQLPHPFCGCTAMALGWSRPSEMTTERYSPFRREISIRLKPWSVQYRFPG